MNAACTPAAAIGSAIVRPTPPSLTRRSSRTTSVEAALSAVVPSPTFTTITAASHVGAAAGVHDPFGLHVAVAPVRSSSRPSPHAYVAVLGNTPPFETSTVPPAGGASGAQVSGAPIATATVYGCVLPSAAVTT